MSEASMSAAPRLIADPETGRPCRRCKCSSQRHQHHHHRDYCGTCGYEICPSFRRPLVPLAAWLARILRRER